MKVVVAVARHPLQRVSLQTTAKGLRESLHGGVSVSGRDDGIRSPLTTDGGNSCAPAKITQEKTTFMSSKEECQHKAMPQSSMQEWQLCAAVLHNMKPQTALAWTASTPQ